jgi:hypothetical protein
MIAWVDNFQAFGLGDQCNANAAAWQLVRGYLLQVFYLQWLMSLEQIQSCNIWFAKGR